jgi:hypothetical protein
MKPITANANATLTLTIAPVTPAAAYLGAAVSLLTGVQPLATALPDTGWPLTFVAGQIVECALKAFLAGRGVAESVLKKSSLRHNLLELWALASSHGFSFDGGQPVWFSRLSELHSGPYVIRYPMGVHGVVLPQCVEMARDLPLLVQAVRSSA